MKFEELYVKYNYFIDDFFKEKTKNEIKEKSQYFTPLNVIDKMLINIEISNKSKIKILDPACGCGILLIKLVEKILSKYPFQVIEIDAYDIDEKALNITKQLFDCLKLKNVTLNLWHENFLLSFSSNRYDYIIANPPYKKTNINLLPISLLKFVNGQPNLYHLFIGKSLELLEKKGIFIVISPKNYLAGKYTENLRKFILKNFSIVKIHTFNERSKIFENKIVQEVCILHIVNKKIQKVNVSYNNNENMEIDIKDLILDNKKNIIITPRNYEDIKILKSFSISFEKTIGIEFFLKIGKTVQFRVKDFEKSLIENEYFNYKKGIPLIVYRHINTGFFNYRKINEKNKNRAITILDNIYNKSFMLENANYIFLKKNIDKNDDKLVFPVLYLKDLKTEKISIDNNVAYFTNATNTLSTKEAIGIFCILNSVQFDMYYRMINSSHTINIYELECMHFPSVKVIQEIGERCLNKKLTVDFCSNIIKKYLKEPD